MIGVNDLPRREGQWTDRRGRGRDRLPLDLGLQPDHVGIGPAVEEELVDRLGDVPEEGRLGVEGAAPEEAAEPGLVVGEAEQLDRLAELLGLERVRVADEDRLRRRRRGDRVGRARELLDVDARVRRQHRHGYSPVVRDRRGWGRAAAPRDVEPANDRLSSPFDRSRPPGRRPRIPGEWHANPARRTSRPHRSARHLTRYRDKSHRSDIVSLFRRFIAPHGVSNPMCQDVNQTSHEMQKKKLHR